MSSDFTRTEVLQEAYWRKCAADPQYFFENYWMIQTPDKGAIPFQTFDAQREALEVFQRERYVVTLKARQIGWTTLVSAYAFWATFFHSDRPVVFLSRGEREAIDILAKVKYGYKRLPKWMQARGPSVTRDNQQEMPFSNGSSIQSLPSKKDPARGKTVWLVIVDEWAFLENPAEAWASIEPIVDVGGSCIGLSTANGWGNFFHEMWVKAETGVSNFVPLFYPWDARDDRTDAWYADKRASLPEWQLHQEYPRTPDEAFIKSGNPVFDTDMLRALETLDGRRGYVLDRGGRTFVDDPGGELTVWHLPEPTGAYVVGADTAEGLEHGDFSSAHVIELRSGLVVAHWHGHVDPDLFGSQILHDLGRYYNHALMGVEANNHGHSTLAALKNSEYPNIYYQWTYDERTKRKTKKIGWHTSKVTKPLMIDEANMALREGRLIVRCRFTIGELLTYVRDERGGMGGSPFDDRVVSLAIANQMRKHAFAPEHRPFVDDSYTMDWWARQVEQQVPRGAVTIGSHNVRGGGSARPGTRVGPMAR